MPSRSAIYRVVDEERDYQDSLGPDRTDGSDKTVGDYLTMLEHYARRARDAWAMNPGCGPALDEIRKCAAICVRCMEEHGFSRREHRPSPV